MTEYYIVWDQKRYKPIKLDQIGLAVFKYKEGAKKLKAKLSKKFKDPMRFVIKKKN